MKLLFNHLQFGTGKHHWDEERWLQDVKMFCKNKHFRGVKFNEEEVAAIVLLLYPSFGKTKLKKTATLYNEKIFSKLGSTKTSRLKKLDVYHSIF